MLCARCGHSIGNGYARFCPKCGYELNSYSTPLHMGRSPVRVPAAPPVRKPRTGRNAAVAVCVVLVLTFGLLIGAAAFANEKVPEKVDIQQATDSSYFELSGDFLLEKEIFTVALTSDGKISFTLNSDISSRSSYYSWRFFDSDHVSSTNTFMYSEYTGETIKKTEPVLYYLSQTPGRYIISVDCYTGPEGNYVFSEAYSGNVTYVGTVTRDYAWNYGGADRTAHVTFSYDEYRQYKDMNARSRAVYNYGRAVSFVTHDDPAVISLTGSLLDAYGSGRDTAGQDFASFVLAFVQICYGYPPYSSLMSADKYLYGQSEYFAYPLETIFHGMGDCEDTSILAAALFKALGYSAGVVLLPGHAVAAVGLDRYVPGPYSAASFEILSQTVDGITYYACETTVSSPQGIGLITLQGNDGKPYSWYMGKLSYRFYIV